MPQIPHNKFQVTCPSAAHLTSIILLKLITLKGGFLILIILNFHRIFADLGKNM